MNVSYGKWDGATTLKFVLIYRNHPCLWDSKSVHYKNNQRRMNAYTAMTKAMGIPGFGIPEAKIKIKNLRSTFSQELKKIRENSEYEPNLRWFKAMEAVYKEMLVRRQGYDARQDGDTTNDTHESDSEELETEMLEEEIFLEETPASPPKKKRKINIKNPSEFLKIPHTDPLNSTQETECPSSYDIFGKSVAAQLKNLSPKNALLAKSQIQNILTEFGIKNLGENDFVDGIDRKWDGDTGGNNFN